MKDKIINNFYEIYLGDCIELMKNLEDNSIDLIICDLPFQVTACSWDVIIPFDKLWEQYNRIIKPNCAIILFGIQPFTSKLICSNLKGYKYNWVWEKSKASNFLQVKNQPLKNYEDVCIFTSKGEKANYYPQMTDGEPYKARPGKLGSITDVYNKVKNPTFRNGSPTGKRYPKAIQYFKTAESEGKQLHPTQKSISMLEYFILTYSLENSVVLDNCMGSSSTGIACLNTNRRFIGMELNEKFFNISKERLENHLNNIIKNI